MDSLLTQKVYAEVKDALNTISKKRKHTLFFQKIMWGIAGLYFVLILFVMVINYFPNSEIPFLAFFKQFQASSSNPYANIYPVVGLIALIFPTTFYFTKAFQKFKLKEAETISKMVGMLFPKVDFTPSTTAPIQEITKSKLFAWVKTNTPIYNYGQIRSKVNNRITNIADIGIVEENVSNKISGTLMRIPFLNILVILYQYVIKNVFTNKATDTIHYTFRGMFCWLNFNKKLSGHTVIIPRNQRSKLNRLTSFNFKEEQKIILEDPRFTNQFLVYSTNQVEARYVLSTAIMERIIALKEKFNQPLLLSFHSQQMYLAIKNENGLFSFPSGKLDNIKIIEELANDIETALQIATRLKLK